MGQTQQKLLVHVFAEQQSAFLGAGGAEAVQLPAQGVEDFATEGAEVLAPASRALAVSVETAAAQGIGALDPGDSLRVVAAVQKVIDGLDEARQTEASEAFGKLSFVAGGELGEVGAEQSLERADASLAVGALWGCLQGQRLLIGHKERNDPKARAAFPSRHQASPKGATAAKGQRHFPPAEWGERRTPQARSSEPRRPKRGGAARTEAPLNLPPHRASPGPAPPTGHFALTADETLH